jgi:hypothetical protein
LGIVSDNNNRLIPTLIPFFKDLQINFIKVGFLLTSFVVLKNSTCYSFGYGFKGELGQEIGLQGNVPNKTIIQLRNNLNYTNIYPGNEFTILSVQLFQCFGYDFTDPNVCGGKGYCIDVDICICKPGITGKNCELWTCYGISVADPTVCSSNGNCLNTDSCICKPGSYGLNCISCPKNTYSGYNQF